MTDTPTEDQKKMAKCCREIKEATERAAAGFERLAVQIESGVFGTSEDEMGPSVIAAITALVIQHNKKLDEVEVAE